MKHRLTSASCCCIYAVNGRLGPCRQREDALGIKSRELQRRLDETIKIEDKKRAGLQQMYEAQLHRVRLESELKKMTALSSKVQEMQALERE